MRDVKEGHLFDCYVDWQDLNRDTILTGVAVDYWLTMTQLCLELISCHFSENI